jgi:hypothetical protein
MDPKDDVMCHNKNNTRRTKAATAIPMVGAIVTAAILLSGLSFIGSHSQPVLAQMDATTQYGGGGATTGGSGGAAGGGLLGGNQTMGGGNQTAGGGPLGLLGGNQTAGGGNATNATMAAGGNATNATMAAGGNATNATTNITAVGGGQVSEEEGGRIGLEEERAEGENESPGQTLAEEEQ